MIGSERAEFRTRKALPVQRGKVNGQYFFFGTYPFLALRLGCLLTFALLDCAGQLNAHVSFSCFGHLDVDIGLGLGEGACWVR